MEKIIETIINMAYNAEESKCEPSSHINLHPTVN